MSYEKTVERLMALGKRLQESTDEVTVQAFICEGGIRLDGVLFVGSTRLADKLTLVLWEELLSANFDILQEAEMQLRRDIKAVAIPR